MARIQWDKIGERFYETGIRNCALFVRKSNGDYNHGVAWNGLTTVVESPKGSEASELYADDIKYVTLRSAENFEATIEAYTYPDEFIPCEGIVYPIPGVLLGQQPRREFSVCYVTTLGNDVDYNDYAYKLHIVYNCTSSPSEKDYQTTDDSPDAILFSWSITSIPVLVEGYKPTSVIVLDSSKISPYDISVIEDILYGTENNDPTLLMPDEIVQIIGTGFLSDEETDYILIGGDRICV